MKPQERNRAVDGVKGIAIIIVLLHHFVLAFYPSIINNSARLVHTKAQVEMFIYKTPLSIFFAGSFAVSLFFLITGYILTKKIVAKIEDKTYVPKAIYSRIFRLMPLIAIVLFSGYIIMNLRLTFNIPTSLYTNSAWFTSFFPLGKVSLQTIVTEIITKIPFVVSARYYNVLWVIPAILFGSWITYASAYIFHDSKIKYFMYIIFLLAFYNTQFISFLIGMALAENEEKIHLPQFIYYIGLILALIFGSSTFSALRIQGLGQFAYFIKVLSAALFFLSFMRIDWLNWIAQTKILVYFGRNSYYYYLTHMLALIMLPSFVFLKMIPTARYFQAVFAAFGIFWIATMIYSEILKKIETLFLRQK